MLKREFRFQICRIATAAQPSSSGMPKGADVSEKGSGFGSEAGLLFYKYSVNHT